MASSRVVVARLTVDGVEGVITSFRQAGRAAQEYARVGAQTAARGWNWIGKNQRDLDVLGGGLTRIATVGTVAMGALSAAAISWQSDFAGVAKTVDGTASQLQELEGQLRGLATSGQVASSHGTLASIAEGAGQLGVARENVIEFTRVVAQLGDTTNLTADSAADLARFANIMGMPLDQISRLGSSIVEMGNNFATTESEVMDFALRLGPIGKSMGLTAAETIGLGTALSSVGIQAEAGGTAITQSMTKIDQAVRAGGAELESWAEIAGMTAKEFGDLWASDATAGLNAVVEGLGSIAVSGGDAQAALSELGVKGVRETAALMSLAQASEAAGRSQGLLAEATGKSTEAWEVNLALAQEAQTRYETTASQGQIAINKLMDVGISLGETFLPIAGNVATAIGGMADGFGKAVEAAGPLSTIAGSFLLVGTMAAGAVGGALRLAEGIRGVQSAISGLGLSQGAIRGLVGGIGAALTLASLAVAAWADGQQRAATATAGFTAALKAQGDEAKRAAAEEASRQLVDSGLVEEFEARGASLKEMTLAIIGTQEAWDKFKQSQAEAISGQSMSESDAQQFEAEMSRIQEIRDAYMRAQDQAQQMKEAADEAGGGTSEAAAAQERYQVALQASADETKDLVEATQALANELLTLSGSQIGQERAIASLNERLAELKEGGEDAARTLDLTTESGRKNQEALNQLASSSMQVVKNMAEQGYSSDQIASAMNRARDAWIRGAQAMGMSADEAKNLAASLFQIPETKTTNVSTPGTKNAIQEIAQMREQIKSLPKEKQAKITALLDRGQVAAAKEALDAAARNRTVVITVRTTGITIGQGPSGTRATYRRDGALVDYYASGGIRERHVAQIAPAGSWRVWAEPETGGEAYIPLAASKRQRSLAIWRETGHRLGVTGYSAGALLTRPGAASATASGAGIQITQQVQGPDAHVVAALAAAEIQHEMRARRL